MVFIDGVKYACERCIRGHRVTACQHIDQPLTMIKRKGRPSTQCQHCREHRKMKNLHTRCQCGVRSGPHSRGCPCHFDPELCTCANKKKAASPGKRASPMKGSSVRRTASNPPSATPSRIQTPGPLADMTRSASASNLVQFGDMVPELQEPWRFPYRQSGYAVPLQPPSMVFADVAYGDEQMLPQLHRSDDSISSMSSVHTLPAYPVYDQKPFAYFDDAPLNPPQADFVDLLEGDSNNTALNTCAQTKLIDDLWLSGLLQGSQYV